MIDSGAVEETALLQAEDKGKVEAYGCSLPRIQTLNLEKALFSAVYANFLLLYGSSFFFFWVESSLHWLYITCFPVCQFVHLFLDPHVFLTQFDLTTVVTPAMMYGLNTVALTKIQQVELEGDGIRN